MSTVVHLPDLHFALQSLFRGLAREQEGYVTHEPNWIQFFSDDAWVVANLKDGEARIRIRAYFLDGENEDTAFGEEDILRWVESQPQPATGMLQAFREGQEDGSLELVPRLVFERPVNFTITDDIAADIRQFADAWEAKTVAARIAVTSVDIDNPIDRLPQNAWLLIGDDASYPDPADLTDELVEAATGIYDSLWTAPKNGELGDLVLTYFTAPRSAACFVSRLASRSFWRTDLEVGADRAVDAHQWWAYTTPSIEIEPISFAALKQSQDGYLNLKGRSGHYLGPAAIGALTFVAKNPNQQSMLEKIVRVPAGRAGLPAPEAMTFGEWKTIPSGVLPLEAKVSEYIVRPLVKMLNEPSAGRRTHPDLELQPEHRVPSGLVDFLACNSHNALAAIEVKLGIKRPSNGVWKDSPDFQQITRYMADLQLPGILVDAHSILLVHLGAHSPHREILRAEATRSDLDEIREHLLQTVEGEAIGIKEVTPQPDSTDGGSLDVYFAVAPMWEFLGERRRKDVPVIALLAASPDSPAVQAVPLIDTPAYRDMAQKFLTTDTCATVAREYLGGTLLDPHAVLTLLGRTLPDEHPDLVAMFGKLVDWPSAPKRGAAAARRAIRRG